MDIVTQAIGVLGMLIAFISFQCKENKKFFLLQAASGASFAIHFFLLGSYTGAFLNSLNILRGFACGFAPKKLRTAICILMAVLYTTVTLLTWESPIHLLVLVAQLTGTTVMWYNNGKIIRIAQFCVTSPIWLIHNIYYFSLGGILCESFNLISIVVSILRYGFDGFSDNNPSDNHTKENAETSN